MNWARQHPKTTWGSGIVIALILVALIVPIFWGAGYESYRVHSDNGYEWSRRGTKMGSKRVYLSKGQSLVINYDIEIHSGEMSIHVFNTLNPPTKPNPTSEMHRYTNTTQGSFVYTARESGYYVISHTELRGGSGNVCDLNYTLKWYKRFG